MEKGQFLILSSHLAHPHTHPSCPHAHQPQTYHQRSPHELEVPVDVEQGQRLLHGCPPAGLCQVCGLLAVAEQELGRQHIRLIIAGRQKTKPMLS